MIAVGLGLDAIQAGYTVCFEKMGNLIRIMDTADSERASGFRLKNLKKAQLVIIDEIGYTPITRAQANRFFTFISDTYETTSIIFTTNKEISEWAEMMGDPVLTTAMLDRILHHAKCFSLRGESYRLKHPELFT
jgi:DNA replication protein DnaC